MSVKDRSITFNARLYQAFQTGNYLLSTTLLTNHETTDAKSDQVENITGLSNDTLLYLACRHGWLDVVKHLIEEYSCDPNKSDIEKLTPLHYACRYGHLDVVQYLIIHQQCDVTVTTLRNWTPLHYACRYGYMSIVEYLASLPAVIQSVDQSSVLHLTCKHGNSDILTYLMDKKGFTPDPNSENVPGLLLTACQYEHTQIVLYLLKDVRSYQNIELEEHKALFIFCCSLLKQVILEVCEVAHAIDEYRKSGIHYACQKGRTAIVQHLVEKCGCNLKALDLDGLTPLHIACKYGQNVDLVKYLLSRSECDTLALTEDGSSVLHFACTTEEFDPQMMSVLIKHGASVSKETVQIYLSGSQLEVKEPTVKSAIVSCMIDVVKCDPNVKNYARLSPVQISTYPFIIRGILACHEQTKIYEWIKREDGVQAVHEIKCCVDKCELDLNETASNGDSVLHTACVANKVQIAKYLLNECNFDPNTKNNAGETPLVLVLRVHTYRMLPKEDLNSLSSLFVNNPRWNPALAKKDKDGNTLIHLACQANQHYLVNVLEESDHEITSDEQNMPFELLSDPKIIVDYVVKDAFTYTFKPGTVHQFIWFCKNIDITRLKHILTQHSNKIKWQHEETINCHIGHHMLYLPRHRLWLLMKVCFQSYTTRQNSRLSKAKVNKNNYIFVIDITDHIRDSSFRGGESNDNLLYTTCEMNRYVYHFVKHLLSQLKCDPNNISTLIELTNDSDIMQLFDSVWSRNKIRLHQLAIHCINSYVESHPS